MAPRLSILALTEDSSKQAAPAIRALIKKILLRVEPLAQTHAGVISFLPPDDESKQMSHAQRWRSQSKEDQTAKTRLRRVLATQLASPGGFVFFHSDGEVTWTARASSTERAFEREIETGVRQLLPKGEADVLMSRLILLVPHYSIEAWLYQNVEVAIAICESEYGGADVDKFRAWAADRARLDEVHRVRHTVRLSNQHNQRLAESAFPAEIVERAGASLFAAVERCRGSAALVAELGSTRIVPEDPEPK